MHLGIDASNISSGGGKTHLLKFLENIEPEQHGFSVVTIWCSVRLSLEIPLRPWLSVKVFRQLDGGLAQRTIFRLVRLPRLVQSSGCDVMFAPGGTVVTWGVPVVTMCRNLLPFDSHERERYGLSLFRFKLEILRRVQAASFSRADGLVFLNEYARSVVTPMLGSVRGEIACIPHGVDPGSFRPSTRDRAGRVYTDEDPCHVLYVSTLDLYKHQWLVIEGVSRLRDAGWPVRLTLVGGGHGKAAWLVQRAIARHDPKNGFITVCGEMKPSQIERLYESSDVLLFASTCENMPNVLLEYMAAELPIACVNKRPMTDIIGDAAIMFLPENVESLCVSLETLMGSPELRFVLARRAKDVSRQFSWKRCADETMRFLARVAGRGAVGTA